MKYVILISFLLFIPIVYSGTYTYDFVLLNYSDHKPYYETQYGTDPPLNPHHAQYTLYPIISDALFYKYIQYYNGSPCTGTACHAWSNSEDDDSSYVNLWYNFETTYTACKNLDGIHLYWYGYDTQQEAFTFKTYIWNFTSSAWVMFDSDTTVRSTVQTYDKYFATGVCDLINKTGDMHMAVIGDYWEDSGGCAFVYSYDGNEYIPEVAISDFAVHKQWEYPTYGLLPSLKPINNTLKLAVIEQVPETQYIDNLELWEIVHNNDTFIVPEQTTGIIHTFLNKNYPIEAKNENNISYLEPISNQDNQYFSTNVSLLSPDNLSYVENLYMTFVEQDINASTFKLVVRAKDTGFLSWVWRNVLTLIEPDKVDYTVLNENITMLTTTGEWVERNGLMYIYVKNSSNDYQFVHAFMFGNVEFYHTFSVELPKLNNNNLIEARITAIPLAHQIDEVFIDESKDIGIKIKKIKPNMTQSSYPDRNTTIKQLKTQDGNYLRMDLDDYLSFEFYDKDDNKEGYNTTFLIHANAYSESYTFYNDSEYYSIYKHQNTTMAEHIMENDNLIEEIFAIPFIQHFNFTTNLSSLKYIHNNTLYEDYVKIVLNSSCIPGGTMNINKTCQYNNTRLMIDGDVHVWENGTMNFSSGASLVATDSGYNLYIETNGSHSGKINLCNTCFSDFDDSGCAYVYTWDGNMYYSEVAISDFAAHKTWEYPTYGILNHLQIINNTAHMVIFEEVRETQYIDNIELLQITHPNDTFIIPEQMTGKIHTFKGKNHPTYAVSEYGDDFTAALREQDNDFFVTNINRFERQDMPLFDKLYIEFDEQDKDSPTFKLAIKIKDTGLLATTWRGIVTMIEGDKPDYDILNTDEELLDRINSFVTENGLLYIYIKTGEDSYKQVATLAVGNTDFYHTFSLELEKPETSNNKIELMLITVPYAHQIDEIYIDESKDAEVAINPIRPKIIAGNYSSTVGEDLISEKDGNYLILEYGDYISLNFSVSESVIPEHTKQSYVIYSWAYAETYPNEADYKMFNSTDMRLVDLILKNQQVARNIFIGNFTSIRRNLTDMKEPQKIVPYYLIQQPEKDRSYTIPESITYFIAKPIQDIFEYLTLITAKTQESLINYAKENNIRVVS